MRRILIAAVISLIAATPALAEVRIQSSAGGLVEDYMSLFTRLRQSGERVVIDGPCLSACTPVLVTIPQSRLCVTRNAVLGFHAPQWVDLNTGRFSRAREATRLVTASYPAGVRAWIKRRGGLTQKLIFLRGQELARLYRRC